MMIRMERAELRSRGSARQRPARYASMVVEELGERIISGALTEGDVLPTEPALCDEFGLSRTVVREGLKLLEERGLVRVEQGRGTTVQPRSSWDLLDPGVLRIALGHDADMTLLDDLITVRRVLEREMARTAAARLTPTDLADLAEIIAEMDRSFGDYDRFRLLTTTSTRRSCGRRETRSGSRSCGSSTDMGERPPRSPRTRPHVRRSAGRWTSIEQSSLH